MKPNNTFRNFLAIAGSSLLAVTSTSAQTLYFDGSNTTTANGVSNYGSNTSGTPHIWDTTTANWDNGSGYVAWITGRDANLRTSTSGNKYIRLDNSVTVGALAWPTSGGTAYLQTSNSSSLTVNGGIDFGNPAGVQLLVPVTLGGSQTWSMGGTNSTSKVISGGTNLNGHTLTWNSTGTGTNSASYPQHSGITGSGNLVKDGAGFLRLLGTNTYTGSTTISAGTIITESETALGNANNQLTVNTGGTLNMGSQSLTVGNLTGTGGLITSTATSGTRTLTIGSGDNGGGNFQGVIENGTTGSTTALTKIGNGTLTLSGVNTYTGNTTVTAGTLLVNNTTGSGTGAGAVLVGNNGTIGGTGTVGGATTIEGNLNPGNSPGVLSFSNSLALTTSSTTTFEINGTTRGSGYDGVNVGTTLGLGGDLVFELGTILTSNATFNLFDVIGLTSGDFDTVSLAGDMGTGSFSFAASDVWSLVDGGGNSWSFTESTGNLVFTAIPEPGTALLGCLGLLALLRRRR